MQFDKKTVKTILGILCGAILFAWCLVNNQVFFGLLHSLVRLLSPFLIGLAIAFVLNVPTRAIEGWLFRGTRWKQRPAIPRILSLVLAILFVLLIFVLVIFIVVPEVASTFRLIGEGFPSFLARLQVWADQLIVDFPTLGEYLSDFANGSWEKMLDSVKNFIASGAAGNLLGSTVNIASSVVGGVFNFFIGFIFAVYILLQKEKLAVQGKKLFYAWMGVRHTDRALYILALSNKVFSNFLTGQCLEAVILGAMFFVSMTILRFPYAMLVAVLISVTALIPIFGAFIGCFVGGFLMMVQNPMQAVWFVVLFLVLQQIEGNLIYPKVVGSSIGLPAMWVMVAVTVGGSTLGIIGMLLMVPIASVIYALLRENTDRKLAERAIPKEKYLPKAQAPAGKPATKKK
ncbi:MAG: AI-2E family transporter [Pygmaiobacter massiliensis]